MRNFRTGNLLSTSVNINKNNNIVVNSLIPDELQQMVDRAMEEREEKYIKKKNITMKVLPEFQSLFAETKEISSKAYFGNEIGENGRFYTMIGTLIKEEQRKQRDY